MSAEAVVRDAVAAAVRGAIGAQVNGVFVGPPMKAATPWVEVGEALSVDWGTKDQRGRELRVAVTIRDATELPARLGALSDAAERAIEGMPRVLGGWEVASVVFVRARTAGDGPGRWLSVSEYRVRVLEN